MTHISDPHITGTIDALTMLDTRQLTRWGQQLGETLTRGGRLLVAGNGGSASQAEHLAAELLGRYLLDRPPLSAIALSADTSTLTAIGNDFGFEQSFSRQIAAHGRVGDVLLVLTTSGSSANILAAIAEARRRGLITWALTGTAPNPAVSACQESIAITGTTANVQESHLVAIHLLCAALDDHLTTATVRALAPQAAQTPVALARDAGRHLPGERQKLVVIGDVLLDETLDGGVQRICPDAPVPVVDDLHRTLSPGGAGLAALLAAADGHSVTLITALNDDDAAGRLTADLSEAAVTVINLGTASATAVKTRIRSGTQTVLMLDHAEPPAVIGALTPAGQLALDTATAILVADYGRGVAARDDIREQLRALAARIPLVWDPHPHGPAPVPGVSIVTPNRREALHFTPDLPGEGLAGDIARAHHLRDRWGARHVVVTLAGEGAILVGPDATFPPLAAPAPQVSPANACGAGDRFAGVLAVLLAASVLPSVAVRQAVQAATAFIATERTQPLPATIAPSPDALAVAELTRAHGGTVVATGGCFDLLHRGHVAMLQQARRLGDCLIVCLNSDTSVTRLKGHPRPLVTAPDRLAILRALACVDAVLVFDDDTPLQALALLEPDIYVKGGDYAIDDLPERDIIERGGGKIVLLPYLDGRSTTALIERAQLAMNRPAVSSSH